MTTILETPEYQLLNLVLDYAEAGIAAYDRYVKFYKESNDREEIKDRLGIVYYYTILSRGVWESLRTVERKESHDELKNLWDKAREKYFTLQWCFRVATRCTRN